ncbi:hypothetical protein Btru_013930 [Bulinus truncatus]|nr:hypothetical protein Btru_013930 [Bulinus truncatus]
METEEEDDSNSLLSLSQSLLQPDNSSSISLSANQINSWSSSVVGAGDMVNHFSPVSPADGYNSQVLSNNDDSFTRFYNFRPASGNQQTNKSCSFIRMDATSIPIDNSFPSSSSSRLSASDFSHTGSSGNHGNIYFDQTMDSRNSESYSIKEPEGTFRNSALGQYDHISQARVDSSSKGNVTNFNHNESYNNIMNLVSESEEKLDIFEQRTRPNDYVKDVDSLYEQSLNKSALKGIPNNDMLVSLDRRHLEAPSFENDLDDFPSSTREFTASSSKLDSGSATRLSQQVAFHHQQGGFDNICQIPSSHKHSSIMTFIDGESQLLNSALSAESNLKRIPVSSCSGFGNSVFNENDFARPSTSSQKKSSFAPLTELSDLEPVFHGEFSGNHKLSPESHMSFYASDNIDDKHISKMQSKSSTESKDSINKWSGRPRAHRKMARLLGSDMIKESFHVQGSENLEKSYSKTSNDCIPQCKNSYQPIIQNDFASGGRSFLTMDEELDLRTSQQHDRHFLRRDEALSRHQVAQREMGFMQSAAFSLDSSTLSSSLPKDSMNNMLPGQQFLMPAHLDLDFHSSLSVVQPARDVDLSQNFGLQTVSKAFETDQTHSAGGQEMISFEQQNLQHISQQDLSLPENLGLGSHSSQDLNLDAYFIAPNEKEVSFGRKCASQIQRDNTESDFNIEEFMNHKDISQSYFDRTDLPQDMTLYQKSDKLVEAPEIPMVHKDRIRGNQSSIDKQSEISELQKELTKTSTKESMKGIRTPRDINRALEILQGLQQNEREEERRKEHQLRHQQYQSLAAGASPKKTFHNKHLVEQMGMSVQPFLGQSSQFMEDQSMNSFLDQSHLTLNDTHQNGNLMLTQYQQNKKDALGANHSEGDGCYHAVKKLPSLMKDFGAGQSTSMFLNQHSNLASMLTANTAAELPFSDPAPLQFQNQQSQLDGLANKLASYSSLTGAESLVRKAIDSASIQSDTFTSRVKVMDANTQVSDDIYPSREQEDILMSSRESLYVMMTREEFCDAVLSTPKQTVKIHQAVLCSMSQYLCTLLLNMKPNPSTTAPTGCAPASPSSFYFSQSVSNQGVLLLVNSDEIKPSSISAFLVFIYLGKAEFSESNVQDLYMLACSLKVTSLEDLCKKFMWSTQMSDDHIKVPQLLVFSRKSETRDQSSMAELGAVKLFEDKCISTAASNMKYMEASTQTDRSTTEAGGGGQEEWVMLKKTKQKTVSPSKSRLLMKSGQGSESPSSCKVGKKGWLSPKKNKVEIHSDIPAILTQDFQRNDSIQYSKGVQPSPLKETPDIPAQDAADVNNSNRTLCSIGQTSNKVAHADFTQGGKKLMPSTRQEPQNVPVKHQRTTVEIAAAAAAAKLSAHSYGTRLARGHGKSPVSYAVLASLQEKKKFVSQKEKSVTAVSKKKDFIKSNPSIDFSTNSNTKTNISSAAHGLLEQKCEQNIPHDTLSTETSELSVKRPFKKSIVHRTQSDEVLRNTFTLNQHGPKDNFLEVNGKSDLSPGQGSEYLEMNVGHVSTLIDSFVNSIEPENVDVDFQKAISDLDSELNRSPLLAPTTSISSVSSTSLTSPLKSPQLSLPPSETSSPFKVKSTPQGFRKRLIQMMNSENCTALQSTKTVCPPATLSSLSNSSDKKLPSAAANSSLAEQSNRGTMIPAQCDKNISEPAIPVVTNGCVVEKTSLTNSLLSSLDEQALDTSPKKETSEPFLNMDDVETAALIIPEEAPELGSFSLMTDIDLGLNDHSPAFHHKIFKRKKKNKIKKSTVTEAESNTVKAKRLTSEGDSGCSVKPRHRKVTGSDSEGGGGSRPKLKKAASDRLETQANFRPPPKKRAKMELELLKAASEVKTNKDCAIAANKKPELETPDACQKRDGVKESVHLSKEKENVVDLLGDSKVNLKTIEMTTIKKRIKGHSAKKALMKSLNDTDLSITATDTVLSEEAAKLALLLDSKAKNESVKNQFTCTLCQSQFRSARRTVKHMLNHGISGKELLDLTTIGPNEGRQNHSEVVSDIRSAHCLQADIVLLAWLKDSASKHDNFSACLYACSVCGYKTKDQSYHYMHYHKYFKHGIPLPMGWKADCCEICGKECFTKFHLKEHMETHEDTKGYICWVCGQSFKSRNCFNSHVFHKHNDIRKYKCKVCEKSFKTWTQLKVHVRSHTGDRPFSCTECDHRSTTQGNMKLHLVTHGLDKEQIKDVMEKITKDVPEMTPESLDQIMEGLAKKAPAVKKSDKPSAGKKSQKNLSKEKSEVQVKSETVVTKSRMLAKKQKNVTLLSMLEGADLSRWEPSKVMVSLTNQSPAAIYKTTQVNQGRNETGLSRLVDVSSLNTFLQAQHQQSSIQLPEATTLFIPLSASDQDPQLQHQQSSSSKSPVLSYTTIPTFLFSGPPGLPTTLDSNSILTMTSLSGSELGAVPHTIQFVQSRSTAGLHHTSQDVVSNGVNVLGSFNFPISEYTVITTDADNCDGGTVTLRDRPQRSSQQ